MGPLSPPVRAGGAGQTLVLRKALVEAQAIPVGAARRIAELSSASTKGEAGVGMTADASVAAEGPPAIDRAAQIEAAREQALEQGYADGFANGAAEAKKELAQRRSELQGLVASIEESYQLALAGIEDIALGVAWEAVCKILGEAAATREGIRALVEQGASKVRTEERMVVRLCPDDIAALREDPTESGDGPRRMEFLPDASIEMGGCVIETGAGRIDATLETQMTRLREALVAIRLARRKGRP